MGFLNVVSLPLHIDEIRLMLSQNYFDVLALNETRLDQYYTDVCVEGYDIVRHDRHRSGGGVCIYVRKSISFVERSDLVPENLEAACIEVTKPNSRPLGVTKTKTYENKNTE